MAMAAFKNRTAILGNSAGLISKPWTLPPRFSDDRRNHSPVMKLLSLMNVRIAGLALALALARAVSAQSFTLTLQPSAVTLIPNQNASFVVSMTALSGFNSQVTLAVETLPFGVTAQFSPTTLTPPGTSILTLSAATNAALGSFTLDRKSTRLNSSHLGISYA